MNLSASPSATTNRQALEWNGKGERSIYGLNVINLMNSTFNAGFFQPWVLAMEMGPGEQR